MVVDVTNLEPSHNINLKLNKSPQLQEINNPQYKNLSKNNNIFKDIPVKQDSFELKNQIKFNFKTNLNNKNFVLNATNTLKQATNKLVQLREIAQQNLSPNIDNNGLYENQYKFEQIKNDFNKFVEEANYKSRNILKNLRENGVVINNNDNNPEIFRLNKFEIDGFDKNTFKIDNLNINDDNNSKKTIESLQQAEKYFNTEEQRLNSATNQLANDLLKLLENNLKNTDKQENINSDIRDITDLLLKNPNEFYNSQANLIQNTYLEILQEF